MWHIILYYHSLLLHIVYALLLLSFLGLDLLSADIHSKLMNQLAFFATANSHGTDPPGRTSPDPVSVCYTDCCVILKQMKPMIYCCYCVVVRCSGRCFGEGIVGWLINIIMNHASRGVVTPASIGFCFDL